MYSIIKSISKFFKSFFSTEVKYEHLEFRNHVNLQGKEYLDKLFNSK